MTLEEVARRARVSTATVSRVLNNGAPVKSSTRARVLRVMQELKYSPNLHAQSLAGGRSRSIGVIVSNIENPFFLDTALATGGSATWAITRRSALSTSGCRRSCSVPTLTTVHSPRDADRPHHLRLSHGRRESRAAGVRRRARARRPRIDGAGAALRRRDGA
jgi:transcriptional regulator with XRE-family HTH domain